MKKNKLYKNESTGADNNLQVDTTQFRNEHLLHVVPRGRHGVDALFISISGYKNL